MKIKKFIARNYKEALELIKNDWGDDAVILSTEEKKGNPSYVEITAATDYDKEFIKKDINQKSSTTQKTDNFADSRLSFLYRKNREAVQNTAEINSDIPDILNNQINVNEKKEKVSLYKPLKQDLLEHLINCSISKDFATNLCKKARCLDDIIYLIKHQLIIKDTTKTSKVIMLIGPTGVGKTTTVAKLAAKALKEGKRVGLINLDTYRIGACEQIRIYARIMGIPLYIASGEDTIKEGITRFMKNRDLIFIDTMGRNPKDEEYNKFLSNICLSNPNIELHLLLSANSDCDFMMEAYKFYKRLPISCIAFTKIDEAIKYGSLYNLLMTYRKPVAYVTTGQKVPDDIGFPTVDNLSELIVGKGHITC